jgi:Family of unknown function (DUF6600)/FecR protein
MKCKRFLTAMLTVALALGFGAAMVMAQDDQSQSSEPASGAARVSVMNGNVTTQRGDSGDWVATTVNAPLVLGDRISTGPGSRTEVQLDYASVLRLDQNSEAKIADLTRSRIQVQLAQGLMDFSVFKGTQADVEIDTPNVAVQPNGPGTFRIQVNNQAETQVIVRDGEAQISTPQGSTTVKAGDLITVEGSDSPQYQVTKAPGRDAWDDWNRDRDNVILNASSYSHTDRYYTGSQDLDRSGRWTYVPGYDWCWTPYVDAGWVPYRDGRWVWEPGWGWTWVSYEPWGWAPYHYGRWFAYEDSWYWWPGYGGPGFYPVWAPAYVSFIGFGWGHYGFGFGFSSIGWLPLGPRDYFHPWWGRGRSYNTVNITNINNITNISNGRNGTLGSNFNGAFNNSRVRGALTTVSTQDFVNGHTPRRVQSVNVNQLRQGSVVQGTLPVVPTRQSLSPANRPATVPAVAHTGVGQRNFFTRNQPPAGPQPFAQHAAQIQQMVRQRNTMGTAPSTSSRSPAPSGQMTTGRTEQQRAGQPLEATTQASRPGWQRFGRTSAPAATQSPASGARAPRQAQPETRSQPAPAANRSGATSPGWRRFGSANSRPAPSSTQGAPRSSQPATKEAPRSAPRSQLAVRDNPPRSSNWRQFSQQPGPRSAPSRAERAQPGWNAFPSSQPAPRSERMSFPSRSESPVYRAAPRSYQRPPLEIRKPIVVERSPRSYGSPSRGWGGSRGGGRSAPRPSSHTGGGGGHRH